MEWTIPGTVITAPKEDACRVEQQFSAMFLAGGMVLSQVSGITGLEPHAVQNWVKRGFLTPPQNKRYTLRQLCRIININMLKSILPMERVCGLMTYINGDLGDESDDIIDDSSLYFMFVRLASRVTPHSTPEQWRDCVAKELEGYQEPVPGAKQRVERVLTIMVTAWTAAQLRKTAEKMVESLNQS